ncbi:MAG TPA: metallophosphoesterase [Solirubrobacterales bacterium]|nr:metallophosphoesterase [Solirubrobacterales bacterium]
MTIDSTHRTERKRIRGTRLVAAALSGAVVLAAGVTVATSSLLDSGPAAPDVDHPAPVLSPTVSGNSNVVRVIAVGDIACPPGESRDADKCHHVAVSNDIAASKPQALFLLGDIQYEHGSIEQFRGSFDRAFGRFRKISRPVPGNHEYYDNGAAGYFKYFGKRAHPATNGYYSFNLGRWHVVALNSNCEIVSCAANSPQVKWLRRDLKATQRRCVAAMWHHPRFSSGEHGNHPAVAPFWKELQAAGASVVLGGHDHDYERLGPQTADGVADRRSGLRSFVAGTGGRSLYKRVIDAPNSERFIGDKFGMLKLTLRPDSYLWRFVDEAGVTRDKGSAKCATRPAR